MNLTILGSYLCQFQLKLLTKFILYVGMKLIFYSTLIFIVHQQLNVRYNQF